MEFNLTYRPFRWFSYRIYKYFANLIDSKKVQVTIKDNKAGWLRNNLHVRLVCANVVAVDIFDQIEREMPPTSTNVGLLSLSQNDFVSAKWDCTISQK